MTPYYEHGGATLWQGDCRDILASLPAESVQTCVTSPPYFGLRDYNVEGQIGLEQSPAAYVAEMVAVFREVRRVLREDGTLWLNLGDSYANATKWGGASGGKHVTALHGNSGIGRGRQATGLKEKDLIGIPWRVAFALQADGWYLRSEIIWSKTACMPESVKDRPTKSHEQIFLLSKQPDYYYDQEAIMEPLAASSVERYKSGWNGNEYRDYPGGQHNNISKCTGTVKAMATTHRNKRSVWTVGPQPFSDAHFATFPPKLIEPCILAGCPAGGTVLDPFAGAGTTLLVAKKHNRTSVGIELSADYCDLIVTRLAQSVLPLQEAI